MEHPGRFAVTFQLRWTGLGLAGLTLSCLESSQLRLGLNDGVVFLFLSDNNAGCWYLPRYFTQYALYSGTSFLDPDHSTCVPLTTLPPSKTAAQPVDRGETNNSCIHGHMTTFHCVMRQIFGDLGQRERLMSRCHRQQDHMYKYLRPPTC